MNSPTHDLKLMTAAQLSDYFNIPSRNKYTCADTDKEYSPAEIAEMAYLLFSETLPKKQIENILITLAHLKGKPIPAILKTFRDLQKSYLKYFAECAYNECCMWNNKTP